MQSAHIIQGRHFGIFRLKEVSKLKSSLGENVVPDFPRAQAKLGQPVTHMHSASVSTSKEPLYSS